jgi:hypothetical protein
MNPAFQDAIKEAFAIAPSTVAVLHTLEVRQTGVQAPIYIVKAKKTVKAHLETGAAVTFNPCGFDFSLPPADSQGFQSLNIAIDNVGREVSDFVNVAQSQVIPVQVIYRPYLSDNLTTPQMDPPLLLTLKDVKITPLQITGRATFMDLVNKHFPLELYTRERFPTLG